DFERYAHGFTNGERSCELNTACGQPCSPVLLHVPNSGVVSLSHFIQLLGVNPDSSVNPERHQNSGHNYLPPLRIFPPRKVDAVGAFILAWAAFVLGILSATTASSAWGAIARASLGLALSALFVFLAVHLLCSAYPAIAGQGPSPPSAAISLAYFNRFP